MIEKMRIGITFQDPPWVSKGGAEVFAFEVAKRLSARGHDVTLIAAGKSGAEVRDGVKVVYTGMKVKTGIPAADCLLGSLMHFLTGHIGLGDFDVLYMHTGILSKLLSSTPCVMHTWGEIIGPSPVTLTRTSIDVATALTSDRIVAASKYAAEQYTRFAVFRDKVRQINPSIDTKIFRPVRPRIIEDYGLKGKKVIVFVGRVIPSKGAYDMIEIARLVTKENKDTKFLLIGPGNDSFVASLKKRIQNLGMAENFEFVGPVDNKDLPDYYSAADLSILPSHFETFGMVNLESQACGSPVIAYNVGGVFSTIINNKTGFLVKYGDYQGFADKINLILCDAALRKRMGKAGIRRIGDKFVWEKNIAKLEKVFAEAIGSK
ncbi:MAG: glycosyltransferase family 4 protein [Candidatus Aenigmatarchaeota archaeon]